MKLLKRLFGIKPKPVIDARLYQKAIKAASEKPLVSHLQKRLGIGYCRACELMEKLEADGIVSAPNASGKRKFNRVIIGLTPRGKPVYEISSDSKDTMTKKPISNDAPSEVELALARAKEAEAKGEFNKAEEIIYKIAIKIAAQRATTDALQQRLGIGYNKAFELLSRMEKDGIVSAPESPDARWKFLGTK